MSKHTPNPLPLTASGPGVDATQIPALHTERLRLRAFSLEDLPGAFTLWADEKVVRFIGAKTRTEADVWAAISRSFGHWALLGFGYWAIADKASNRYLGEIGFLEGLRNLQPPHETQWEGLPEAGWALAQNAWGQGLATEALTAVCQWADQNLEATHTQCLIDPKHGASLKVAHKNGFTPLRQANLGEHATLVLTRARQSGALAG